MIRPIATLWGRMQKSRVNFPPAYSYFYENVLGTSLELKITCASASLALQAEQAALAEMERLENILSRFRPDSEFRRWIENPGKPTSISEDLWEVLAASDTWREWSNDRFHPAVESVAAIWRAAANEERLPDRAEVDRARRAMAGPPWRLDNFSRSATRGEFPISLHGIAKGYIVDRVCDTVLSQPGVEGVLLNVGGDLRTRGASRQIAGITDPDRDAENAPSIARVRLQNAALATSGDWRRGIIIGGALYSHLIDPRTGVPADRYRSVSVIAPTAMEADAVSTIFSVSTPQECATLAETRASLGYLLITRDGASYRNTFWEESEIRE